MDYMPMTSSKEGGSLSTHEYLEMREDDPGLSLNTSVDNCRVPLMMDTDHPIQEGPDASPESPGGYQQANNLVLEHPQQGAIPPMPVKKARLFTKQQHVIVQDPDVSADDIEKRYRGASLIHPQNLPLETSVNFPLRPVNGPILPVKGQRSQELSRIPCDAECAKGQPEDYQNDPTTYLTPAESPPYSGSFFSFSAKDITFGLNEHHQVRAPESRVQLKRFDSGVDCATERGSTSTQTSNTPPDSDHSVRNSRLSTHQEQHYEDIDNYSRNRAASRPPIGNGFVNNVFSTSNGSCMNGQGRPLPDVNLRRRKSLDDNDPILTTSIAETVSCVHNDPSLNFDPRLATLPHTYTRLSIETAGTKAATRVTKKGKKRQWACLAVILILLFFISVMALAISIYILISAKSVPGSSSSTQEQSSLGVQKFDETLKSMKETLLLLEKENSALKNHLSEQSNKIAKLHTLETFVNSLNYSYVNLTNHLELLREATTTNISNIGKTIEPQLSTVVMNYSLCVHKQVSRNMPADAKSPTLTEYLPSILDIKQYFVTFAYCTHDGATESLLDYSEGTEQYRCKCKGIVPDVKRTMCTINIWMCPRN